jgi:hypothetical protein
MLISKMVLLSEKRVMEEDISWYCLVNSSVELVCTCLSCYTAETVETYVVIWKQGAPVDELSKPLSAIGIATWRERTEEQRTPT